MRAHRYDTRPHWDKQTADGTPRDADPAAFLDFAAGPVDHVRGEPQAYAKVLDSTELAVLGTTDRPF
ncbi:hypothetical protein [Actinacidiphila rubida]|uniref:Uncharacterized protein n=1 Tax=Actinacidiphila rubida TaxID=310780 RepID=A0A1H8MX92_9ACTN|nr:hypothetical protein [Actinacidiphila rubida]SEO21886.1 hypothetical protein SAMN05216267_102055 [Actinacidiphila rubida]